jgi:endonuclease/exonuclease/phosphatase family metal-dependent hydrolase
MPNRIGEAVAELDVDVLAMQEVDRGSRRVGRRDLADLAQKSFEGALGWATAVTLAQGGDYGNALLVRGDIVATDVVRLPGRRRGRHAEPRVALVVEAEVDGRAWSFAATHLSTHPLIASEQLLTVLDALGARPAPRVLLGDLNLEVQHVLPALTAESYRMVIGPLTHPAHRPRRQIDHVAVSGAGCTVTPVGTLQLPVGDHRALIADVRCPT